MAFTHRWSWTRLFDWLQLYIYYSRLSSSSSPSSLIYENILCQSSTTRTDSRKDLRIFLGSILHFHNLADYLFSQCIKLLGLFRRATLTFTSTECMYIYFTLVTHKLEHALDVWNPTNAHKLEGVQLRVAALCANRFFTNVY